jgi:hypothetical protein
MTMEATPELVLDRPVDTAASPIPAKPKRRQYVKTRTRPQLLLRSELDGRTNAAKYFDRLVSAIETGLAGPDQLSSIKKVLVEAYAGAAVTLQHLNSQLALGQPIDVSEHSSCVGALVRVASRLGVHRRQKTVPSLDEYLAALPKDDVPEQQP